MHRRDRAAAINDREGGEIRLRHRPALEANRDRRQELLATERAEANAGYDNKINLPRSAQSRR
jgi:hypothetical protein